MAHQDEIEFNEPTYGICECCGARTTGLVRYVYRDGNWIGVYYASLSDTPSHDWVSLLVALGDLSEAGKAEDKAAVALQMWAEETGYQVRVAEPDESPWDTDYFGKILSRKAALVHPWLQDVFDLTDHIVICDIPIKDFLEQEKGSGSKGS
jgi:hypothetical protein